MHVIRLNSNHGSIYVDSALIEVRENGTLVGSIAKLCASPIHTTEGGTRYRLLRRISVFGQSADGAIEVGDGPAFSVTVLFDLIEFFEFSILESKVIRAFEKELNLKFMSDHPSTAFLDSCKWGNAIFIYDAKQGDLSLEIRFERC